MTRKRLALAAMAALLVLSFAPATSAAPPDAAPGGRPPIPPGLREGRPDGPCRGMLELANAPNLCTHGHDELSRLAGDVGSPPNPNAPEGWPCYGTGQDGPRVQALYAFSAGTANRIGELYGTFVSIARIIEGTFAESGRQNWGPVQVRFATDGACNLSVPAVQVSPGAMSNFNTLVTELQGQGHSRTDRKYLVWLDAQTYCGLGTIYSDDRPTPDNYNNGGPSYSSVGRQCWNYAEPHEIMHNLGGVQLSAPHRTNNFHCWDQHDYMCYDDGSGIPMRLICPAKSPWLFDCNYDDCFTTYEPPGSYLDTRWNSVRNQFLLRGEAYWPGRDLGRGMALRADGVSGYKLDGWGGVHPFGGAPRVRAPAYWSGWDITRDMALRPDGVSGYVLDGYGGIHPFGAAPSVGPHAYWPGWDIARDIVLRADGVSGYTLDGYGGIHPFGGAPPVGPHAYWSGWDIAREIVLRADGVSGYTLDGWGGVHPFGGAPRVTFTGYWSGWDIARRIVLGPDGHSGFTLDGWGGRHPFF